MSTPALTFEMTTPERPVLSRPADFVVLPAVDGEFGVLPGHSPFVVQLRAGELRVRAGGETLRYAVSGGFAEVLDDRVAVFAETAEMAGDIDVERARLGLEKAKAALHGQSGDLSLAQAEAMMHREAARLRVAGQHRRGGRGKG